ncbi:MAG: hypothetical protein JRD87_10990 [Deltaproteobacteria bacterium]|jgi:hypothetical protein|nr:hypothetical protein [Deltaproteobacteria bacterium]MBW2670387.1 hypothetical protein [Deltaproteobacteria bacterium]
MKNQFVESSPLDISDDDILKAMKNISGYAGSCASHKQHTKKPQVSGILDLKSLEQKAD